MVSFSEIDRQREVKKTMLTTGSRTSGKSVGVCVIQDLEEALQAATTPASHSREQLDEDVSCGFGDSS